MDRGTESSLDDASGIGTRLSRLREIALRLRTLAVVLLVVGFGGAIAQGSTPIEPGSIYSYLFFAGVACAIAAVYLGIFGGGNSTDS